MNIGKKNTYFLYILSDVQKLKWYWNVLEKDHFCHDWTMFGPIGVLALK